MAKPSLCLVTLFLLLRLVIGQTSGPVESVPNLKDIPSVTDVPTVNVVFKDDESFSGLNSSPVLGYPSQCTDDGTVFVRMAIAPDFSSQQIYSIRRNEVRSYSKERITDLYDIRLIKYFATDSVVLLLVNAAADNRLGKATGTLASGERVGNAARAGERHYYLAKFDHDGTYKESVEVDDSFGVVGQVGIFDSEDFLVAGVDPIQNNPRLALLKSDGSLLRLLDLPKAFAEWSHALRESIAPGVPDFKVVLPVQFVRVGKKIVLVPMSSKQSSGVDILEVSESGEIRKVRLNVPSNFSIDSFVPSNDRWYVRFRTTPAEKDNTDNTVYNPALYEVDSTSGLLKTNLRTLGVLNTDIECVHDGKFIAFRDDKGKFVGMLGEITR